jgi:hypothetical protein
MTDMQMTNDAHTTGNALDKHAAAIANGIWIAPAVVAVLGVGTMVMKNSVNFVSVAATSILSVGTWFLSKFSENGGRPQDQETKSLRGPDQAERDQGPGLDPACCQPGLPAQMLPMQRRPLHRG